MLCIVLDAILESSTHHLEDLNKKTYELIVSINAANIRSYTSVIKSGDRTPLGTDPCESSPTISFNYGISSYEYRYAADIGLTLLQAIEAGTAKDSETLAQAPNSG